MLGKQSRFSHPFHLSNVCFVSFYTGMMTIALEMGYSSLTAFEFSKRSFQSRYGQQLPVWALLASGATGGVSVQSHLFHLFFPYARLLPIHC